jgi:hypothetical protein
VQHRDALDRADGQVEVRHLMRVPAPSGRPDVGELGRAGVRVGGQEGGHCCVFPFGGCLGLPTLDQEFAAGTDVVLVEAANDLRVDPSAGQSPRTP